MKRILTFAMLFSAIIVHGDTVFIHHQRYDALFDTKKHVPVGVVYTLRGSDLQCGRHVARTNDFKADPTLPGTSLKHNYAGSGYDIGHQMPAQDNECDEVGMHECFYFTNMVPQVPALNRGVWKNLEDSCRKWAVEEDSIRIYVGWDGLDTFIGPDRVWVPINCDKIIYHFKTGDFERYHFPNYLKSYDKNPHKYEFPIFYLDWLVDWDKHRR